MNTNKILDAACLTVIAALTGQWLYSHWNNAYEVSTWFFGCVGGFSTAWLLTAMAWRYLVELQKQQIESMQHIIDRKQAYIDKHFNQVEEE